MRLFPKLFACLMLLVGMAHGQNTLFFQTAFNSATVSAPTFSPASPYTGGNTSVTITAGSVPASGQTIYYCVTTTTCTPSTVYTGAISFASTENVFAYSAATGYNNSATVEWKGTYVVTPAILQSNYSTSDCATPTCTVTLPSHVAGGMTCVFSYAATNIAPISVSNTAGFTWNILPGANIPSAFDYVTIACASTTAYGSTDTFTVNRGSGVNHGQIAVVDVSNVSGIDTSAGAGYQSASSTSSGTPNTGSFSVAGPNDMVLAVAYTPLTGLTPGTGYTNLHTSTPTYDPYFLYGVQSGTSVSASLAGSSPYAIMGVALK